MRHYLEEVPKETPKIDTVRKADTVSLKTAKDSAVALPVPPPLEIESWPGERFALLEKPAAYCTYGYELYTCNRLDSCRGPVDTALSTKYHRVKCGMFSKLSLKVRSVERRPADEWLITFEDESTGNTLFAATSKGVYHEIARASDLDGAQKRWKGKIVFSARGFVSTFENGKTGTIKVRLQDSLRVVGVRFGITPLPTKPIWLMVTTPAGGEGVIPVYYSWTNVKKELRHEGNPWDDDIFESNPALAVSADDSTWSIINSHHVRIGMTRDQVRLSWGSPQQRKSETYKEKERECWEYTAQHLYFDEKELIGIAENPDGRK